MGGAVSAGEDNEELVDNLVKGEYIKSPEIELVFRALDRGHYYADGYKDTAYRDTAWKHGNLHLSAPCIYSEVMESLELKPGVSFLNLGSGTGYLNTMAGLMIGSKSGGRNHGIELHGDVVKYAREKLSQFKQTSPALYKFDFCEPIFLTGNILSMTEVLSTYDRIYVGAAVTAAHMSWIEHLLKIGGILVAPLNEQLIQVTRISETQFSRKNILPVSFASLIEPANRNQQRHQDINQRPRSSRDSSFEDEDISQDCAIIGFPDTQPSALKELCRNCINNIIRKVLEIEEPNLFDTMKIKSSDKDSNSRSRVKRRRLARPMAALLMASVAATSRTSSSSSSSDTSSSESSSSGIGDSPPTQLPEQVLAAHHDAVRKRTLVRIMGRMIERDRGRLSNPVSGPSNPAQEPVNTVTEPIAASSSNEAASSSNVVEPVLEPEIELVTSSDPESSHDAVSELSEHELSNSPQSTSSSSDADMSSDDTSRTSSESSSSASDAFEVVTETDSGNVQMETDDEEEDNNQVEDSKSNCKADADCNKTPSMYQIFGSKFQVKLQQLPLPKPIQVYLNFERPFEVTH